MLAVWWPFGGRSVRRRAGGGESFNASSAPAVDLSALSAICTSPSFVLVPGLKTDCQIDVSEADAEEPAQYSYSKR